MEEYKLFINGEFVDAGSGATFESIDPGTGAPFAKIAKAGKEDAEAAIKAARRAFDSGVWSDMDIQKRSALIIDFADMVAQQSLRLVMAESMDAGQIVRLSKFMPMMGSGYMKNMATYAATEFPWEEEIPYSGNVFAPARDYIRREPIGVCVGIIPWNFPMAMAHWKIGSALAMGNTMILKPATSTPVTALIIAECAKAAGIPDGVLNVITGPGGELGEILCTHPDVDKVALTGSTEVGKQIMKKSADTIKKVSLELGGKSANIILDDADMELAVEGAMLGTFNHQGQMCESGTRILVSDKIYDDFIEKFKAKVESLRVGYQLDPSVHQGPLANAAQLATVERYVKLGQEEGARLLTGGKRLTIEGLENGYYFQPTIFVDVDNKMRIAQEEIFGPVVCVIKFSSDDEAVAIANDSIYGLGGGVFSRNTRRAEAIAKRIRTGTMWINSYHQFGDYCAFGGYKQSGIGRELGHHGLAEYTEIKRMHIASFPGVDTDMNLQLLTDRTQYKLIGFDLPTKVSAGHGSLTSIYKELADLGCKRALIITDKGVNQAGLVRLVQDAMVDFCVGVYEDIPQDTYIEAVDKAVDAARTLQADCIVSVGGGSVIDAAKMVCVALTQGGSVNFHIALSKLTGPQTPHIAIPTTSGTGSEVSIAAMLGSKTADRKVYAVDRWIAPNVAILDPRMTMSLPKLLTTSTAMDAISHAFEALTSTMSHGLTDGICLQAIRLIGENLPLAVEDGQNEEARLNLQLAATLGGWAVSSAQVGLVHGMAHSLGSQLKLAHGIACGLILPHVIRYNAEHATRKYALAAQALGVNIAEMSELDAALAAADAVENLMKAVDHPLTLKDAGVAAEGLDVLAFHAAADLGGMFNARQVTDPMEIYELFQKIA